MYVCMYVCMCMYVYAYLKNKSHVLNLPCILVARVEVMYRRDAYDMHTITLDSGCPIHMTARWVVAMLKDYS